VAGIIEAVVPLYLLSRPDIPLIATMLAIGFASTLYGVLEIVAALEVKNLPSRFDTLTKQTDAVLGGQLDPARL
jgi:uncharacterized membrane protein HdeD (DUF308 family)